jgi:hypothetical protein
VGNHNTHSVFVVADVQLLVGVDVQLLHPVCTLPHISHKAPDGEVIEEQLVPVCRPQSTRGVVSNEIYYTIYVGAALFVLV